MYVGKIWEHVGQPWNIIHLYIYIYGYINHLGMASFCGKIFYQMMVFNGIYEKSGEKLRTIWNIGNLSTFSHLSWFAHTNKCICMYIYILYTYYVCVRGDKVLA
jgi:hypothetical protein